MSADEIGGIFKLVAPTALRREQVGELIDLVCHANLAANLRIDRSLLLRIMAGSSLANTLRTPAFGPRERDAICQLARDIRYQLYLATMMQLDHSSLTLAQWSSSSGFINDPPQKRRAASTRWLELLRGGHKIGDRVTTGLDTQIGIITTIAPSCMVTLRNQHTDINASPGTLRQTRPGNWLEIN